MEIRDEPVPFDERGAAGHIGQRRRRAVGHQISRSVELVIG
jgi:hypothetical protein